MNAEQETAKSIALATAIATACDTQSCHQEQQHQNPGAVIVYIDKENHEDDGKGIGISMFILLLVGLIFNVKIPECHSCASLPPLCWYQFWWEDAAAPKVTS